MMKCDMAVNYAFEQGGFDGVLNLAAGQERVLEVLDILALEALRLVFSGELDSDQHDRMRDCYNHLDNEFRQADAASASMHELAAVYLRRVCC